MPLAESRLLRRGRFSEPGRLYMLTTKTHLRLPLFHDFDNARLVVRHLRVSDDIQDCRSLAWVVMPDHLHWLIELKEVTLGTLMRKFKSRTAIALRKASRIPPATSWALLRARQALHADHQNTPAAATVP